MRGHTRTDLSDTVLDTVRAFDWLAADPRPLDWNGPVTRPFTRFDDAGLDRPIVEHFERVARQHRNDIAIRDANSALTFGELWDAVSGLAEALAAGTEPGDLIAILLPAGCLFPVGMLACLAAGRPFVALDTRHPPEWLAGVLSEARPKLIITQEDGLDRLTSPLSAVRLVRLTSLPQPAGADWRPASMGGDEPACVLFTSGSTGRPKSVVNSQRNLLQRAGQSINAAHINAEDRLLTLASPATSRGIHAEARLRPLASPATIVGVRDVITALLAGASIQLLDPHGVGAREIVNMIRAEGVTILFAFPALLRSVVAARQEPAGPALRLVRVGGDTTVWSDVETLRAWLAPDAAIQIVYAATEAPMMQWFVDEASRREDVRVPIGHPLPGNHLAIVDERGHAMPRGEVGELVVGSRYVSLGSWCDERAANDCSANDGASPFRIFRTGDLVRMRPDGLLERVGRKDRQVKIRGSRVDLDGVEAILHGHAGVRDVAVFGRPADTAGTSMLVAYVSPRDAAPGGLIDELKASMRSAAPSMRPSRFYLEPSIPRLPNSKLDVRALAALDEEHVRRERRASTDEAAHASIGCDHVSQIVSRAWETVLRVPVRSVEDDFFDSGGDSLNAVTFILELERALGLEISLTLINEAPRFDQLCRALTERRAPSSSPLVTLKAGQGVPPVFFIHGVGGNLVEILPAARRMTYAGEIIGIRARGVVRGEKPHTSIEAMAEDYLSEIKKRQSNGPYQLCGYSSGGLAAFEIARRLSESGDEVRWVGLFDTTMSPVRWPLRTWLSIGARRIALAVGALRASSIRSWPAVLRKSSERLRAWRLSISAAPLTGFRVAASALLASAKYRPGFYAGELTMFSPATREPGLPSLESVWRTHARTIVVVETPGTHLTMLSSRHAETTAACVTRCLPAAPLTV